MKPKIIVKFTNPDSTGKKMFGLFEPTIEKILNFHLFEKLLLERLFCFQMLFYEPPDEALQKLRQDT